MSLFLTDPDQWYESYEAATSKEQYALLYELISQPIPINMAIEHDLSALLVQMWDELVDNNLIAEALALITALQQQPELYRREAHYFATFLVRHALFHQQPVRTTSPTDDPLRMALDCFYTNPVNTGDQLDAALADLRFYGATDPLVELCQAIFDPLVTQSLPNGDIVSLVLSVVRCEQAYQQIQQGEAVDWDALAATFSEYQFKNVPALVTAVKLGLTTMPDATTVSLKQLKSAAQERPDQLMLAFCCHMATTTGMNFVCSQAIWQVVFEFLSDDPNAKKPLRKRLPSNEAIAYYCTFRETDLETWFYRQINHFVMNRESYAFALVWGLPYVYEFLSQYDIIPTQLYTQAITLTESIKCQILKKFDQYLWQLGFICRWPKPSYLTDTDWEAQMQQFTASLDRSSPLGDEPIDRVDKLLANVQAMLGEKASKGLRLMDDMAATGLPTNWQWQLPKPPKKKSPLREAGGLSPNKKSSKKFK